MRFLQGRNGARQTNTQESSPMKKAILLAAATMTASLAALPAFADDDMTPARLQKLDDQAKARGFAINHLQAIEIAKANGIVTVREIDLEDEDEWKVEGRNAEGRGIEVELSARDGKVRKVEND
jgi:uncharacterized membrane protein YkoI